MQLELQLAVERLHARYVHALDTDNLEQWPNFFTEQGRYRITTAENEARGLPLPVMYAEGRSMLRDRVASLRHAFHSPRTAVSVMRESPEPMNDPPISITEARSGEPATPRCTKPVAAPSSIEM